MKNIIFLIASLIVFASCTAVDPKSKAKYNKCKDDHKRMRKMGLKY